jgi:hypothetical protein
MKEEREKERGREEEREGDVIECINSYTNACLPSSLHPNRMR